MIIERKAGTRVRMSPLREARFEIPVVRKEIDAHIADRLLEADAGDQWLGLELGNARAGDVRSNARPRWSNRWPSWPRNGPRAWGSPLFYEPGPQPFVVAGLVSLAAALLGGLRSALRAARRSAADVVLVR